MSETGKGRGSAWSVYMLAAPDGSGHTYYKIGVTSDISQRVRAVQTDCPLKITRAWVIDANFNGSAQALERDLLGMLAPYKAVGSWFRMDPKDSTHQQAQRAAFAYAVEYCSAAAPTKWRQYDVPELREMVRGLAEERAAGRRKERRAKANLQAATMALHGTGRVVR